MARRSKRFRAPWREIDFERWFAEHPVLPGGERLLIVSGHEPIRRMVDITAVDTDGGIVVLEVKNEKAHRTAIGQSLEYLSHLDSLTLEDLEDDFLDFCGGSLSEAFQQVFAKPLEALSARRRVFLIAPTHDSYAAVCADYLSRALANRDVHFGLLVARQDGDGFTLSEPEHPPFKRPTAMAGALGTTPGGRLMYVLDGGHPSVVWSIGRWDSERSTLTFRASPSLKAVRSHRRLLLPVPPLPQVDLSQGGTHWAHRTKKDRTAILVGCARPGSAEDFREPIAVFAEFRTGIFKTFRRRPMQEIIETWIPVAGSAPDWREIAGLARAEALRRRENKHKE